MEVQVGPETVTIHADDEVVVCEPNLRMSSTKEQGYFARDSRFVSGYRIKLGRAEPVLLNSSAVRSYSARFEFTNAEVVTSGGRIPAQTIHMRVDRRVGHGVHDDYDIVNHGRERIVIGFEVSFESDFADIFDVKRHQLVRRGSLQSHWDEREGALTTTYKNGDFRRALRLHTGRAA